MSRSTALGTILRAIGKLLLLMLYTVLRLTEVLAAALSGLVKGIIK